MVLAFCFETVGLEGHIASGQQVALPGLDANAAGRGQRGGDEGSAERDAKQFFHVISCPASAHQEARELLRVGGSRRRARSRDGHNE